MRFTRIGAWLSGAVMMLGLFSFAGATAASAQAPASRIATQTTCPTDAYTRGSTACDNGSTGVGADNGSTGVTPASSNSGGGSLASTGVDILLGILAAVLLILLGTALTLAARERRQGA